MENVREPVVAGYFYPSSKAQLLRILEEFIKKNDEKEDAISIVVPHAGYIYSGKTAGAVYSKIIVPDTVIIIGPNHTGYGEPYAVSSYDCWLTPIGKIPVNKNLVNLLVEKSRYLQVDNFAHEREHSVEVQLPFLQVVKSNFKIVPITLMGYIDNPAWIEIGEAIAESIKEFGEKVLIVASSDMTHYKPHDIAEENDKYAIESICCLDEDLLIERILEREISICGYAPIIVSIVASKILGAQQGDLIRYTTSGETSGDFDQVVGYAGIIIK